MRKINTEELIQKYIDNNWTIPECAEYFKCGLNTINRRLRDNNINKDLIKKTQRISESNRKLNWDEILKLFDSGLTPKEISSKLSIGYSAITKILRKNNRKRKKKCSHLVKLILTKQELEILFLKQNMRVRDIAKKAKVSVSTIELALSKYNIKKPKELNRLNVIDTLKNNGNCFLIEGKTLKEVVNSYGGSITSLVNLYNDFKQDNKELTINNVEEYIENNINRLELLMSNKLKIKKFNKNTGLGFNYQPDFKLNDYTYINVDGLYWHSEKFRSRCYHFKMRQEYEEKGARIYQFLENEILNKTDIVLSMINHNIGKSTKIYARKCKIIEIDNKTATIFLEKNHLMGSIKARHVGLLYNEELVSICSYKYIGSTLKIERFCNKTNTTVVGGFSKLLKKCKIFKRINKIEYWVDLRYGTGDYLLNLGFVKSHDTLGWKWTDFRKVYNRRSCRANMDIRKLSEREHAKELKWFRIYDAGQRLYVLYV